MVFTKTLTDDIFNALQGRWRVVYSEIDGEMNPVEEFASIVLVNTGNTFVVEKDGESVHEGTFSINASVLPHEIVYIYTKSSGPFLGGPRPGIIQLVGKTLKTTFGAIGHRFPNDFNTFPGASAVLSIHERIDDGAAVATLGAASTRAVSQW